MLEKEIPRLKLLGICSWLSKITKSVNGKEPFLTNNYKYGIIGIQTFAEYTWNSFVWMYYWEVIWFIIILRYSLCNFYTCSLCMGDVISLTISITYQRIYKNNRLLVVVCHENSRKYWLPYTDDDIKRCLKTMLLTHIIV